MLLLVSELAAIGRYEHFNCDVGEMHAKTHCEAITGDDDDAVGRRMRHAPRCSLGWARAWRENDEKKTEPHWLHFIHLKIICPADNSIQRIFHTHSNVRIAVHFKTSKLFNKS